ncbi:MAG: DUF4249 domain-containing protein [Saprospirales bacterium]|nr:DUF4249 domain-containing protein [Saprospirales bacterium]
MQKYAYILILANILASGLRCVRETDIQLPDEPAKIVALSHFTIGEPVRVEVSLSQTLTDAGDPEIPFNADVSISVDGKFLDKLFRVTGDGGRIYWESRDLVVPKTEYTLAVRIAGLEPVAAHSSAPEPVEIAEVRIDTAKMRVVDLADGRLALRVPLQIRIKNLPAEKRYFAFSLQHEIEIFEVIKGQPVPDEYYEASTKFLADGRTLALVYDTPEKVVLVNENFWSDERDLLNLDALIPFDPAYEKPRRLFVDWRTLSDAFYRYHLSLARQGNNFPLNDPDALFNNIEGGYGNFSGYSVSGDTVGIPEF